MARGNLVKTGPDDGVLTLADGSVTTNKLADKAVTGEKIANRTIVRANLAEDAIPPASVTVLGGIKLYSNGSTNRSGLAISDTGIVYVDTKSERGITRDDKGQIQINPATQEEIATGTERYKPVTPATLAAELERRNEYSATPQQIGTWIDGMPVWRAAFKAPITDTMKIDKACSIFYDLSFVKSAERVKLVIGGFACIDNGSVIDNNTTTLDGFGRFNWDSINPNAEYISGYIDFVTEAENIKS